ncbi:MAG: hypothetical protein MPK62_01805 [Alphaproteobacteria bacterium]|nr:hypothetical protein [Alphaproteobacteria bacterium]MDA8029868.1 hypothetical protein [Alphaproteobacteria bacterium]
MQDRSIDDVRDAVRGIKPDIIDITFTAPVRFTVMSRSGFTRQDLSDLRRAGIRMEGAEIGMTDNAGRYRVHTNFRIG